MLKIYCNALYFKVMYMTYESTNRNNWKCMTLNMTEDRSCECGCDVKDIDQCNGNNAIYNHQYCECECRNAKEKYSCHSTNNKRKIWKSGPECRCECHPKEFRECSTGIRYMYIFIK